MSVDYTSLRKDVAHVLGISSNPGRWSEEDTRQVDNIITAGINQYYQPPPVPGVADKWDWSFLHPTTELQIVADQRWYPLPEDFAYIDGQVAYSRDGTDHYLPIEVTTETRINALDFQTDYTSFPVLCAVRPVQRPGITQQRWEIGFFPTPDSSYLVTIRYRAAEVPLTIENPHPLGGVVHEQGIRASVLSKAEGWEHESEGYWLGEFMRILASNITMDARNQPQSLGYMRGSRLGWSPNRRTQEFNTTRTSYQNRFYPS
jgi:hypothetical protein